MDWRVTARTGEPHIKLFHEERERPVFFVVDLGPSMRFGTRGVFKSVQAGRIATLLAWMVISHGDRVGGVVFSGGRHQEASPKARELGVLQFIHTLLRVDADMAQAQPGALTEALAATARLAHPGSLIYLISDFRQLDEHAQTALRRLAAHNDLTAIAVYDPLEKEPPPPGRYRVSDGHMAVSFDSSARELQERYRALFQDRFERLQGLSRKLGFPLWGAATDADPRELLFRAGTI